MLPRILFEILITSVVICKERLLHENEIVQYLQNYKYQDINQGHFRKLLQASTNAIKIDCPTTAHTFFTGCSVLSYFLRLNCYNFRTTQIKLIKLHFSKIAFQPLKTDQNSHSYSNPARSNSPLKKFKNYVCLAMFLQKT